MNWYAAHIIMYVKFKDTPQDRYPIWENIILFRADSEADAFGKAESRGHADAESDDLFRWSGRPAEWVFAGVRKVTLCQDSQERPGDGTEVSYLELETGSEDDLAKLVRGEPTTVELCDGFPDDESLAPMPAACR